MFGFKIKKIHLYCMIALLPNSVCAEGIVDFEPYVSTSVDYDDNVFRVASPEQAKATLGTDKTSDVVTKLDAGVAVNLRLSRQLLSITADVNENKYSRFKKLDNTGKDYGLRWSWRLGGSIYGELSVNNEEAAAGFDEIRTPIKNLRTTHRQLASVNWDLRPDWTLNASREHVELTNALGSSKSTDRQDDVYEVGFRYHNRLDTQLGLSYRIADSTFPNRVGLIQSSLGEKSSQEEFVASGTWMPSSKIRLSTRLAEVNLTRINSSLNDISGFSQHWGLDYVPTVKLNFNLNAYRDVSPVDDVVTTYVRSTGFDINSTWNPTSKISIRSNFGYSERDYLGSARLNSNIERVDHSTLAGVSLFYHPSFKSILQLQYQGENRTSNIENLGYRLNNINFTLRYNF
jgi:exopolysaccharide biosynthesis operon protein EpsL